MPRMSVWITLKRNNLPWILELFKDLFFSQEDAWVSIAKEDLQDKQEKLKKQNLFLLAPDLWPVGFPGFTDLDALPAPPFFTFSL